MFSFAVDRTAELTDRKCADKNKNEVWGQMILTGLRFPVKFRPNRFRFAGVIPEKVISYRNIPSTQNKRMLHTFKVM